MPLDHLAFGGVPSSGTSPEQLEYWPRIRRSKMDTRPQTTRDPSEETDDEVKTEPKTRKCLLCRQPFPSAWAGERVCRKCKSTSAWRTG